MSSPAKKEVCCDPFSLDRHSKRISEIKEMNVRLRYKSHLVPLFGKICTTCKVKLSEFLSNEEYEIESASLRSEKKRKSVTNTKRGGSSPVQNTTSRRGKKTPGGNRQQASGPSPKHPCNDDYPAQNGLVHQDENQSSIGEAASWTAPIQHLASNTDVQKETDACSQSDKTPPPTPPGEDNDQFFGLYLLMEVAVAVQQQLQRERERAMG